MRQVLRARWPAAAGAALAFLLVGSVARADPVLGTDYGIPDTIDQRPDGVPTGVWRGCSYNDNNLVAIKSHGWSIFPQWVPVDPANKPVILTGMVLYGPHQTHVADNDTPFNHYRHDLSILVTPDLASRKLLALANLFSGNDFELGNIEVEWEHDSVPLFVWPSSGDRVHVVGQHVFDCGHPPYRTEIHPPRALITYRTVPGEVANSAGRFGAFRRADIWVTDAGGGAALSSKLTEKDRGGARSQYLIAHGRSPILPPARQQDVHDRDIEFEIDAPGSKPSPDASVVYTILPTPAYPQTLQVPGGSRTAATGPLARAVVTKLADRVRVKVLMQGTKARAYAGSILVGWDKPPPHAVSRRVRRFEVNFDRMEVKSTLKSSGGLLWNQDIFHAWASTNDRWFKAVDGAATQKGRSHPIGRKLAVTLFNGEPLRVWTGGYKEGCLDRFFGRFEFETPDDMLGNTAEIVLTGGLSAVIGLAENGDLVDCIMRAEESDGQGIGPAADTWQSSTPFALPPGVACPKDYGTDGPKVLSTNAIDLYYSIKELNAPDPRLTPAATYRPGDGTRPARVTGDNFKKGEQVTLSFVDGAGKTWPYAGPLPLVCDRQVYAKAPLPLMPGGDYLVQATGSLGTRVADPTQVRPSLDGIDNADGTTAFKGWSFGANESVTIQHRTIAERQSNGQSTLRNPKDQRPIVTLGNAVDRLRKPSALPAGSKVALDWVTVAEITATTDANGAFKTVLPKDNYPVGYGPAPSGLLAILHVSNCGGNDFTIATGATTGYWTKYKSNEGCSDANAFWHQFSNDPNRMIRGIDPVSLVADFDRSGMVSEGRMASLSKVGEYLQFRSRNDYLAPLPAATYAALAGDVKAAQAALAAKNTAAASAAMARFAARLPADKAPGLARWAENAMDRFDPPSKAELAALVREGAALRDALKRKDQAAVNREITNLQQKVPALVSAARASRITTSLGALQKQMQSSTLRR